MLRIVPFEALSLRFLCRTFIVERNDFVLNRWPKTKEKLQKSLKKIKTTTNLSAREQKLSNIALCDELFVSNP